ncbi:BlaI/MecI/CopY family transcriptional regulator [Anaerocolumna xylanovorans]|uniref:BlaI family transcriptional regulator, penicillinase repressor n=1 Tax=Anaerocolumna xylanovorans DSM 12503 TaxID=1121345 RepID=A0A1M7YDI8_9FIRM|nr:BlaI/MecI/CopY family transcriptional regulator [Anaerocolumna xylanovorans]SHO50649.1 BlaI family transcriptional regulator, penicillinase repressor [Anaerocolumna xylanovorans DSM 12503]
MKNNNCKISNAEWLVMKVLWNNSPQTTTSIIEGLSAETDWKPKTIHTLIARLVKKGALGVDKDSGQHTFYPLITREECIQEETGSFIQKMYEGSIYNLMANFIHDEKMSVKEMEDLKKLLDEKLK